MSTSPAHIFQPWLSVALAEVKSFLIAYCSECYSFCPWYFCELLFMTHRCVSGIAVGVGAKWFYGIAQV